MTALFSVVNQAGGGEITREVKGETRDAVRFLSALQQNKHSQGFSICFIISNHLNSPLITFNFQNKLYFQSEQQSVGISIFS